MKIGFDAKRIFFNRSGLGNYGRNNVLSIIASFPDNEYFLFTPKINTTLFSAQGSKIVAPEYPILGNFWRYLSMGKTAQSLHLDVFHGLSNELPRDIEKSKAKKIVTIHDTIFMRFPQWYKWHDRMMYRKKTIFACQHADTIVATSEQTKADLIHFFNADKSKIEVVYQPCNQTFNTNFSQENLQNIRKKYALPEQYMLMVGNIEPRKNILSVIQAKKEQNIDLPLVIVGKKSQYLFTLENYIQKHNIKDIFFYHCVSNEELPIFFQLSTMLIYASHFEGFGIPIVEAMQCGVPVVVSNNSCFFETAGDAGLYFSADNIEDIGTKIATVYNNESLKKQMINNGFQQVKKFNANTIAQQLMKIYQK